jgi:amino acid transporter
MLGLTLSGTFLWLLTLSTLARIVAYMATAGALPVLRRAPLAPAAKFHLPGGVAVSIAAIGLGLWLLSNSTLREARDTALAVGIGLAVYYAYRLWRPLGGARERHDTIEH